MQCPILGRSSSRARGCDRSATHRLSVPLSSATRQERLPVRRTRMPPITTPIRRCPLGRFPLQRRCPNYRTAEYGVAVTQPANSCGRDLTTATHSPAQVLRPILLLRAFAVHDDAHRAHEELEVERQRSRPDVAKIHAHHLVERNPAATFDLPKPGDAWSDLEDATKVP